MPLNVSGYLLIRLNGTLVWILIQSSSTTNAGEMVHNKTLQPTLVPRADEHWRFSRRLYKVRPKSPNLLDEIAFFAIVHLG